MLDSIDHGQVGIERDTHLLAQDLHRFTLDVVMTGNPTEFGGSDHLVSFIEPHQPQLIELR